MNTQNTDKTRSRIRKLARSGLLLLGLLGLILLLMALRFRTKQISVREGDTFSFDIAAPFTGTDSFLTDKARQRARDSVPTVYEKNTPRIKECEAAIEGWFSGLENWFGDMAAVWEQDTEILENKYRFRGLSASWPELVPEAEMQKALTRRGIAGEISVTVAYLMLDKYMPANTAHLIGEKIDADDFKKAFTDTVYPLLEGGIEEDKLAKTRSGALTSIKKKTILSALKTEVAGKLVEKFILPTVIVDEAATEENRRLAAATVADVRVTRGDVLFSKGATVTAQDITHLTGLGLLKGSGEKNAFSFPALFIYASFCILATGLWLILFEKRRLFRTGAMCSLTVIYACAALMAFGFSYLMASAAPVLFAVFCAARERKKEHTLGALLFSLMILPVLLDTNEPFGAEAFITGASLCVGGLCAAAMLHFGKTEPKSFLPAGMVSGAVIGLIRLCPLLWQSASKEMMLMAAGFPFFGGLMAVILEAAMRPFARKLNELDQD